MKKLLLVFAVLVLLALAATVIGIFLSGERGPTFGGPTVLVWRVQGTVPEQSPASLPFVSGSGPGVSVANLYRAFRAARRDDSVAGVALYIRSTGFGLAKAQEFRHQLLELSAAGKFVECYFETVGEGGNGTLGYYLATACDHIHMAPVGAVNLMGLYADSYFLRGTLDKLKIDPEFLTVGEYKSAGEQFTRKDHSPRARQALDAVLDGEYAQVVDAIAERRKLEPSAVRALIDRAPLGAQEAVDAGLLDSLIYPDEFRDLVEKRAGGDPRLVPLETWGSTWGRGSGFSGRQIAMVFASGTIVRGAGGTQPWTQETFVGSDQMSRIFRDLADDSSVAAVVLRIDSPGGSALGSDLILRELSLLEKHKPVIVSMSDLAASGGYYIASKATKIVAEPATLTGSIGVISGRFATQGFEREILGVTHDPLSRGAHADIWSSPAPLADEQRAVIQHQMDQVYQAFVANVAQGRGMTPEAVDRIGRGRVWLGSDALRLGLVDDLGGLDRALDLAKKEAGLAAGQPVRLTYFRPPCCASPRPSHPRCAARSSSPPRPGRWPLRSDITH
jgi:protease-4